jgi:hypothetical protein
VAGGAHFCDVAFIGSVHILYHFTMIKFSIFSIFVYRNFFNLNDLFLVLYAVITQLFGSFFHCC